MSRDHIDMQFQHEWHQLLRQIIASVTPPGRLRPATLWIQLEDLLLQWRELWTSEWFAADQGELITFEWTLKDLIAHVASWAGEFRTQAEILAGGNGVGYRILFDEIGGPRLRQQLAILKREQPRPRLYHRDRLFWIFLMKMWKQWRTALVIVQPATVVSWQRRRSRQYWWKRSQKKGPGCPQVGAE